MINHSFKFVLERSLHQVSSGNFVTYDSRVFNLQKFSAVRRHFFSAYWRELGVFIFSDNAVEAWWSSRGWLQAADKNGKCWGAAKAHDKHDRWQIVFLKRSVVRSLKLKVTCLSGSILQSCSYSSFLSTPLQQHRQGSTRFVVVQHCILHICLYSFGLALWESSLENLSELHTMASAGVASMICIL